MLVSGFCCTFTTPTSGDEVVFMIDGHSLVLYQKFYSDHHSQRRPDPSSPGSMLGSAWESHMVAAECYWQYEHETVSQLTFRVGWESSESTSTQKASVSSNKGNNTSKEFADKKFDKPQQVDMANITWNFDLNDEDDPAMVQEAINHSAHGKQWEKAIKD